MSLAVVNSLPQGLKPALFAALSGTTSSRASPKPLGKPASGCLLAVDHPGYAEPVDEHAESGGPEGPLERHLHFALLRQGVKDSFCLRRILDLERHGKAFWLLIALRGSVRTHQYLASHIQAGMKDFLAPCGRHLLGGRRARVGHHGFDFASQTPFIELERCLALTVENKVRVQLHRALLMIHS